ncbi:MAG: type II secretion system protein GspG [Pirellulaceae bacterium]
MSRKFQRRRRGFTLLEVLLVMAILIIMVSVVTVSYNAIQANAKQDGARMAISQIEKACMAYQLDVGSLPPDLNALVSPPQGVATNKWRGPYMETIPVDPWGGNYDYTQGSNNTGGRALPKPVITCQGDPGVQGDEISNVPQGQ